jgi:hypothetical protein
MFIDNFIPNQNKEYEVYHYLDFWTEGIKTMYLDINTLITICRWINIGRWIAICKFTNVFIK